MLSCGWEKEVLCKVDEAQGKFYHLDDATNLICSFRGHCGRMGELECHRGSHGLSWVVILWACFCCSSRSILPLPAQLWAQEAGPVTRLSLPLSFWLLFFLMGVTGRDQRMFRAN